MKYLEQSYVTCYNESILFPLDCSKSYQCNIILLHFGKINLLSHYIRHIFLQPRFNVFSFPDGFVFLGTVCFSHTVVVRANLSKFCASCCVSMLMEVSFITLTMQRILACKAVRKVSLVQKYLIPFMTVFPGHTHQNTSDRKFTGMQVSGVKTIHVKLHIFYQNTFCYVLLRPQTGLSCLFNCYLTGLKSIKQMTHIRISVPVENEGQFVNSICCNIDVQLHKVLF